MLAILNWDLSPHLLFKVLLPDSGPFPVSPDHKGKPDFTAEQAPLEGWVELVHFLTSVLHL